jgi:hypothetical protein
VCEGHHRGCRPHRLFVMCSSSTSHKSLKFIFQCDTESCSVITIYSVILYHPHCSHYLDMQLLMETKKYFFKKGAKLRVLFQLHWRHLTYFHMGCRLKCNITACFWVFISARQVKKGSHFFSPKHCNPIFCYLRHKSNPLSVPKIDRQLYAKSYGSNGTPLDSLSPLFFGWTVSSGYNHWSPLVLYTMCPF